MRAYVTLREGAERPSAADLIAFSRERIGYKAPDEVVFMDEMPLNPTGKIDRAGLKKMAEEHLHPHDQQDGTSPGTGSLTACITSGEVAQLVEHTTENRGVASSILALAIQPLTAAFSLAPGLNFGAVFAAI